MGVTSYGLFVDVGVADGLVHRSEITWTKGIEPTSLYRLGDAVIYQALRDGKKIEVPLTLTARPPS